MSIFMLNGTSLDNTYQIADVQKQEKLLTLEKNEILEQQSDLSQQMYLFDTQMDERLAEAKKDAKYNYDMSLKALTSPKDEAMTLRNNAQTTLTEKNSALASAKTAYESAEAEAEKKYPDDPVARQNFIDEKKRLYEEALKEQADAKSIFDNATTLYSDAQQEYNTKYQAAMQDYNEDLETINATNTAAKNVKKAAVEEQTKQLSKKGAQIEVELDELNTLKESLQSEKEAAQSARDQKLKDLAPKY